MAQPSRVEIVFRRVLTVGVYQDIDIRELHWLLLAVPIFFEVICRKQRRSLVDVVFRELTAGAERDELEFEAFLCFRRLTIQHDLDRFFNQLANCRVSFRGPFF